MKKLIIATAIICTILICSAFIINSRDKAISSRNLNDEIALDIASVDIEEYAHRIGQPVEVYENSIIYLMRLSNTKESKSPLYFDLQSKEEFGNRINYFSEGIRKDISIIQDQDTLSCHLVHWERSYNIRPDIIMTLVFEGSSSKAPNKLIWHDKVFTNIPHKIKLN